MSETLASLRHKIDGAGKLLSVVRTMKSMAASRIGQCAAAVAALQSYQEALTQGLGVCLRRPSPPPSRSMKSTRIQAIAFGSDQGLVGQLNERLSDFVAATLCDLPGKKTVWAVGELLRAHLEASSLAPLRTFAVPGQVSAIARRVGEIQAECESDRAGQDGVQLYVFHNRPDQGGHYAPVVQRLLPLDDEWRSSLVAIPWSEGSKALPELLGGFGETLGALVHEHLFISVYRACAESMSSENTARLSAMQRAEKNIEELSADLQQSFHRQRQSSIDEELFDVISGFNALS